MEALTLGSIFTKHLGFPAGPSGAVGAESFAERLALRCDAFLPESADPEAWVEHFFEADHSFEQREQELTRLGAIEKAPAVLEVDLGEREYVVIEDEDEVVIVSERGSLVLARTAELSSRLKAATVAAPSGSTSSPFKGPGDRAYFVGQSGHIALLDARLVAKAIEQAPAPRVEPLARVTQSSRLAAFEPTRRVAPPPKVTFAPTEVRRIARAEVKGSAAPQVVVVQKGEAKAVSGPTARFWQRMTTALTAGGRVRENLGRTLPGASAVALGRQTYAVKAGGVTALVQRPTAAPGTRAEAFGRSSAAFERKATSSTPKWARDLLDERARGRGYWIAPPLTSGPSDVRPEWALRALAQARHWRERAHDEARGRMDPPARPSIVVVHHEAAPPPRDLGASISARGVGVVPLGFGDFSLGAPGSESPSTTTRALGGTAPGALPPLGAEATALDLQLPEIRVHSNDAFEDAAGRPFTLADTMPASTLRTLYTALERTSAAEGRRLSSVDLAFSPVAPLASAPAGATEAFVGARFAAPVLTRVDVTTARLSSSVLAAPFDAQGGLRVGADLSDALDRSVQRTLVAPADETVTHAAASDRFEGANARISFLPLALPATAVTLPAAVSGAMAAQSASTRLSALSWLDWALDNAPFAHARSTGLPIGTELPSSGATTARASSAAPAPSEALVGAASAIGTRPRLPASIEGHLDRLQPATSAVATPPAAPSMSLASTPSSAGHPVDSTEPAVPNSGAPRPAGAATSNTVRSSGASPSSGARPTTPSSSSSSRPASGSPATVTPANATPPSGAVPLFAATGPTIGRTAAPAQQESRAEGGLTIALPLMNVNVVRAPEHAHEEHESDESEHDEPEGARHILIGVPLHVQMSEARQNDDREPRPAHALAEGTPSTVTVVVTSPGGGAPAPGPRSAPTSAGSTPDFAPSWATRSTAPRGSMIQGLATRTPGSGTIDRAGPTSAGTSSTPTRGRPAIAPPDLARPGSAVSAPVHRKAHGESLDGRAPEMPVVRPASDSAFAALSAAGPAASGAASSRASTTPPAASAPASGSSAASSRGSAPLTRTIGAAAYSAGSAPALRSGPGAAVVPHEASHTIQQGKTMPTASASGLASGSAPVRRKERGSGVLRFSYPAGPRWWASAKPGAASGNAGTLPTGPGAPNLVSTSPLLPASTSTTGPAPAPAPSRTTGLLPAPADSASASAPRAAIASPAAFGARGARVNGLTTPSSATPARAQGTAGLGASASTSPLELGSGRESDLAFVAVAPTGEAKVMTRDAAAQLARRRSSGAAVDMTVVAGIAPQAPSLDDMARAGHERPHLKGKAEGGTTSVHGKTDALSLQGTVDSLAQRIYHRLKRRLASDRERFGG